jgi:hypothetical protein
LLSEKRNYWRAGYFGISRQDSRYERAHTRATSKREEETSSARRSRCSSDTALAALSGEARTLKRSIKGYRRLTLATTTIARLANERWECNSVMQMCCKCFFRSSGTHQRSNFGVHITNNGSSGYNQYGWGKEAEGHTSC